MVMKRAATRNFNMSMVGMVARVVRVVRGSSGWVVGVLERELGFFNIFPLCFCKQHNPALRSFKRTAPDVGVLPWHVQSRPPEPASNKPSDRRATKQMVCDVRGVAWTSEVLVYPIIQRSWGGLWTSDPRSSIFVINSGLAPIVDRGIPYPPNPGGLYHQ